MPLNWEFLNDGKIPLRQNHQFKAKGHEIEKTEWIA